MYSYSSNVALTLSLCIIKRLGNNIAPMNVWASVGDVQENSGSIQLFIGNPESIGAFAKVEIEACQFDENGFHIGIYCELIDNEISESFQSNNVQTIMDKYANLRPLVTESLVHRMSEPWGGSRSQENCNEKAAGEIQGI